MTSARRFVVAGLCACAAVPGLAVQAHAQSAPDLGRPFEPQPVSQPVYSVKSPSEEPATQRHIVEAGDGVDLYVEAWLPAPNAGQMPPARVPVVLHMTPYVPEGTPAYRPYVDTFVRRGYAYVQAHVRGTRESGGCMEQFGPREIDDTARVIEWLGKDAAWSDGNVGMTGLSYPGITAIAVAGRGDPDRTRYLKAIIAGGVAASQYEYGFWDGVPLFLQGPAHSAGYFLTVSALPGNRPTAPQYVEKASCQPEVAVGSPNPTGDMTPFWQERDHRQGVDSIRAATLLYHGHQDDVDFELAVAGLFDQLPASTPKAGVFGVWGHAFPHSHELRSEWERSDWLLAETAWFDRWLKRLDSGADAWPIAQVQGNDGQWRAETDWPRTGGPSGQIALDAGGNLGSDAPRGRSTYTELTFETRQGGPPPGGFATWESEPLPDRLEITGQPVLDLWVVLDRPDAHLAARLETFDAGGNPIPQGTATGFRSAQHLDPIVDGAFRQAAGKPPPVATPVRVPVRFSPTDLVVPAGGRIKITVAGSLIANGGLSSAGVPEPAFHGPSQPSGMATRVTVLHDCEHPSVLRFLLPAGQPDLLNVREPDEPASEALADNRPYDAPVSDGGGLATAPVCGAAPADPSSAVE